MKRKPKFRVPAFWVGQVVAIKRADAGGNVIKFCQVVGFKRDQAGVLWVEVRFGALGMTHRLLEVDLRPLTKRERGES